MAGIVPFLLLTPALNGQRSSFVHEGLKRTFKIHLPLNYDMSVPVPLVIALHGRGGNGDAMVIVTRGGFSKLADREGFLVVYPDGIDLNWNDGRMDQEAKDRAHVENIDDVGFLSGLIDTMITVYNADPGRVYVTGISNGGIMSYRIACELADKITAIAPVDGNIPYLLLPYCSPSEAVSVLAVNNTDDPLVPYYGGDIYTGIRKVNLGRVLSVDESIRFWADRNGCSPYPVTEELPDRDPKDGTRVIKTLYKNPYTGIEVILYAIEGGGHTWPGGFQYLPVWIIGRTSRDINACEVIWEFFRRHSK